MSIDQKTITAYALRILSKREHSVYELRRKLMTKFGDNKDWVDETINDCLENDWISNERYCAAYIRDQILKRSGPYKIQMKLGEKGIGKDMARDQIGIVYTEDQQKEIKSYLEERKREEILRKKPKISDFELNGKVMQYLRGKGF